MALSFINTCSFPNCDKTFNSQHHLLIHIENTHVDFDPKRIEEVENSRLNIPIPPSYVLRYNLNNDYLPCDIKIKEEMEDDDSKYSSDSTYRNYNENMFQFNADGLIVKVEPLDLNQLEYNGYNNTTSSYLDKKSSYKSDNVRNIKRKKMQPISESLKRFSCPVQGCNKKYKNINGARYHTKHCHDSFGNVIKPKKDYHCACGKQYKTAAGLRSHLQVYSDKNHGVLVTSAADVNNNNNNIVMQRQINPSSNSMTSADSNTPTDVREQTGAVIPNGGIWKIQRTSYGYDDPSRLMTSVKVKCEEKGCQYDKYDSGMY